MIPITSYHILPFTFPFVISHELKTDDIPDTSYNIKVNINYDKHYYLVIYFIWLEGFIFLKFRANFYIS